MSIAELPPLSTCPAERARSPWQADLTSIDHDLGALHTAIDGDRHDTWRSGDVIGAQFETFLSTITSAAQPIQICAGPASVRVFPTHNNAWRDTLDAWDKTIGETAAR